MGLIRQDIDKLRSRVAETKHRVSKNEDTVVEHRAALRTLQTKVKALEYRAEDAENRNRCNNLRIVGLPEGVEGNNPTGFVEGMLHDLLPDARLSPQYVVERALNRGLLEPLRKPSFSVSSTLGTDEILCASRIVGDLRYQNAKLMIFRDYSVETQKLRKSFDHVKAALRARKIRYSVLFPARLRVQDRETTCFFKTPREVSSWLDSLPPAH